MMDEEAENSVQADRITPLERLRARLTVWATFGLLLIFFTITIALWGYAAWWMFMKLVGLFA
ncbi:hypothetical protein MKK70_04825 [Methylobacterium sp. E-041]|uniref:hypothetical protein n=1 Tax=Methylobacterium sp. E-041 TaxID=2836573 RepID=UPI001FB8753F|nr:hypothetical protein [Methylobacterium sp. E-041]MCJ2104710.1 hypothetical protein [Methylobacterium sp. E-041]